MGQHGFIIIVLAVFFIALYAVCIWVNKSSKSYADFAIGGRSVKWYAIGANMSAGLFGATSLMTAAFYARVVGISSIWLLMMPTLICLALLMIFAKKIRALNINEDGYSIAEMMNQKYGPNVRMVYLIIVVIALIASVVSSCIAMGKLVSYYCGWNMTLVMLICAVLGSIYVLIGGFKGISVTSVFQAVFMVFGVIVLAAVSIKTAGGMGAVVAAGAPIPGFNSIFSSSFSPLDAVGWIFALGLPVLCAQDLHQKVISCKTEKDVNKAIMLALVIAAILYVAGLLGGYASAAWPIEGNAYSDSEFFVAWASDVLFGPVMMTILFVGFVSAIVTTFASSLCAAAFSVSRDLFQYYHPEMSDKQLLKITRTAVVVIAVIACAVATFIPNILTALFLTGNIMAGGMTLPLFAFFFSKKATSQGVFWSSIIGVAFVIIDFVLRTAGVALPWPGEPVSVIITFVLATIVLVVVSAVTQPKKA